MTCSEFPPEFVSAETGDLLNGPAAPHRAGEHANLPPAGWYAEPLSGRSRWWDGGTWGPYAETPPARKRRPLLIVAVVAVLVLVWALSGPVLAGLHRDAVGTDVSVTSCFRDRDGTIEVQGKVFNSGNSTASYYFKISYEQGGVRLGMDPEVVDDVEPGQVALWDNMLPADRSVSGVELHCNIVEAFKR